MKYIVFVILLALGGAVVFFQKDRQPVEDYVAIEQAEGRTRQAVRAQVIAFGAVLSDVSLLAPTVASDIERIYEPYITRSLRSLWVSKPELALGRDVSSPWSAQIEVIDIEQNESVYEVRGVVVYTTSTAVATQTEVKRVEYSFLLRLEDDRWKIDSVTMLRQQDPHEPKEEPKLE